MSIREAIPTELRRRVLVEAGHRCAIPTCRFPTTEVVHIEPWKKVRKHELYNLIALCPNCHTRYDRGEIDKNSMLIYKRRLTFLSDRYSQLELNVLKELATKEKVVVHNLLSIKNLIDDDLVRNAHTISSFKFGDGQEDVLDFVATLTNRGKQFIKDWQSDKEDVLMY